MQSPKSTYIWLFVGDYFCFALCIKFGHAESGIYKIDGEEKLKSGKAWMDAGLQVQLRDFQSIVKRIEKVVDSTSMI